MEVVNKDRRRVGVTGMEADDLRWRPIKGAAKRRRKIHLKKINMTRCLEGCHKKLTFFCNYLSRSTDGLVLERLRCCLFVYYVVDSN